MLVLKPATYPCEFIRHFLRQRMKIHLARGQYGRGQSVKDSTMLKFSPTVPSCRRLDERASWV
jgi:hypothetical protein